MKTIKEFTSQAKKDPEFIITEIEKYNKKIEESKLNAFITKTPENAILQGKKVIERLKKGENLPLAGVPLAVKDAFCTAGIRTTMGSKMLENFTPHYESTITERLFASGCVLLGKTNMDEFAMGASGKHSAFGSTISPVKKENSNDNLVPGGSSSGSASASGGELCLASLGTDTGGSVRQPAAFCGIVGFKPTYGRCSRFGMIPYASSLDQAGFLTNTVEDSALLFNYCYGIDGKDGTLSGLPNENFTNILPSIKGKTIGLPKEFMLDGINPQIAAACEKAREIFQNNGAKIKEVSLSHAMDSIKVYYFISTAEASSNLARYDGIKYGHKTSYKCQTIEEMISRSRSEGFGEEVKSRILIGTRNLLSDSYTENYEKILRLRNAIKHEFASVFKECDALLCPTTPNLPFEMNYQQTELEEYINDILTVPVNIAGLPAISIPFGKAACKRPIGLQLIAKEFNEKTLFETAMFLEANS